MAEFNWSFDLFYSSPEKKNTKNPGNGKHFQEDEFAVEERKKKAQRFDYF